MYTLQRCAGTICSLSPFCVGAFNFRRAPAFRKASVENQNVASVGMPTSISTPCSTLLTEVEYYSEHKSCSLRLHEQLHLAASCKTKYSPQVEGVKLPSEGCVGAFKDCRQRNLNAEYTSLPFLNSPKILLFYPRRSFSSPDTGLTHHPKSAFQAI